MGVHMVRVHRTSLAVVALSAIFLAGLAGMAFTLISAYRPDAAHPGEYALYVDDVKSLLAISIPGIFAWVAMYNIGVLMKWWQREISTEESTVDDLFESSIDCHSYRGIGVEPVGYIGVGADQD